MKDIPPAVVLYRYIEENSIWQANGEYASDGSIEVWVAEVEKTFEENDLLYTRKDFGFSE